MNGKTARNLRAIAKYYFECEFMPQSSIKAIYKDLKKTHKIGYSKIEF